jgi:hypothetical protein
VASDKLGGKIGIFMIDENDLENDKDEINVWETEIYCVEMLKII